MATECRRSDLVENRNEVVDLVIDGSAARERPVPPPMADGGDDVDAVGRHFGKQPRVVAGLCHEAVAEHQRPDGVCPGPPPHGPRTGTVDLFDEYGPVSRAEDVHYGPGTHREGTPSGPFLRSMDRMS